MAPDDITDEQGESLPALARTAVAEALGRGRLERPDDGWLYRTAATFVTLTHGGALRGCIGSIQAISPLLDDLIHNARAAAFSDPRFPALTAEELPGTRFEVSLLTPLAPFANAGSEEDVIRRLAPGTDGVLIEWGDHRGTFLPQMWEQLPDPRHFLGHLKQKAGLDPGFWAPDVQLWTFAVRKWAERQLR